MSGLKNSILPLVAAGMIGGAVTVGGVALLQKFQAKTEQNVSHTKQVDFELPTAGAMNVDFSEAAEKAVNAVVHIKTTESAKTIKKNQKEYESRDPFAQFFGGQGGAQDLFGGRNPFGSFQYQPKAGTGSGVIISADGLIVTNNHVVDFGDEFEVTLNDNRTFKATLVGRDENVDLAVLRIEANNLQAIQYGDSDKAKVGQWVLAVGNPFELNSTVTAGIISAKGRSLDKESSRIESYIQTDAPVNPGNSGGALVDASGKLIGINTAIVTHTGSYEGYSFAIPVNFMTKIVDDIIKFGSYQRGILGVQVADLTKEDVERLDLPIAQGALIDGVEDNSAAQYAGIIPNDVVTKVDAQLVKNQAELKEYLGRKKVGETVYLSIIRDGKTLEIPVILKKDIPRRKK
jgi:serine protease Do